jgi:hypothetical protein
MAIISCPECGRQVFYKALKCPQCAHPIANPETRDQLLPPKPLQKEPESIAALMQEWSTQKWLKLFGISVAGTIVFITASVLFGKGLEASREASRKKELIEEQKQLKEVLSKPTDSVNPAINSPSTSSPEKLPPHTVASRVSLGSNRERIQVNSLNPQLSKGDCEKLADNYKPQAGQVSVHKPSLKFKKLSPKATEQEIMQPFCVNNLDGTGIFFNDYFFVGK